MNLKPFACFCFPLLFCLLVASTGTYWPAALAGGEEWRPVDPADLCA